MRFVPFLRGTMLVAPLLAAACATHNARDSYVSSTSLTSGTASSLSDPQIAQIERAYLTAISDEAQLAQSHAQAERVREYARLLHADYLSAKNDLQSILDRGRVTPETTPTSQLVTRSSHDTIPSLAARQGMDFDRAFIDREVDAQQRLLDQIDLSLAPSAGRDMQSELLRVRPMVASRLEEARAIRAWLRTQP